MLDRFDLSILDEVQRDDSQTAEVLSRTIPLSPSAIARRLRRLRGQGWIDRTIALVSSRLISHRLRALIFVQLSEHADLAGKRALYERIRAEPHVQFCYEMTGGFDVLAMVDCANMTEFDDLADAVFAADPTVHRYETSFVKREVKFDPFVQLSEGRTD